MSRILDKAVDVFLEAGLLAGFVYRGRHRVHRVLEFWQEVGDWWQGDSEKSVYRVETETGAVFELYQRRRDQQWFLYKVYD